MKRKLIFLGFLVVLSAFAFSCGSEDSVNANPAWLNDLIDKMASEPVADPPAKIIQYDYKGSTVYYVPPRCCDIMSDLYDVNGNIICHPDGGVDGLGDGMCPDFFTQISNGIVIWEDQRTSP